MSDTQLYPRVEAIARAVGSSVGTLAAKYGHVTVEAKPTGKHRLPRKLKKALKKANAAAASGNGELPNETADSPTREPAQPNSGSV
jgi:hypothetical protein